MYTFYCQFKTGMHMYSEFTVHQERKKEERKKERKERKKERKKEEKKETSKQKAQMTHHVTKLKGVLLQPKNNKQEQQAEKQRKAIKDIRRWALYNIWVNISWAER